MKNETKKALFYLALIVVYIFQGISEGYEFSYVYYFGFILSVAVLYIIKNKYISALAGIGLLSATWFYNSDYMKLTVTAYLLICAHKYLMSDISAGKKRKKDANVFSFCCVQAAILAGAALLIHSIALLSSEYANVSTTVFTRASFTVIWLVGLSIYSFYKSRSKSPKHSVNISKGVSDSLRFMYVVGILSFVATALFAYAKNSQMVIQPQSIFFPWFVYICSMVYNNDVYVEAFAKDLENNLQKIFNKNAVK